MLMVFIFRKRSESALPTNSAAAAKAEHQGNDRAQHLVHGDEEEAREHDQEQHEPSGDQRLAPGRPNDLLGLRTHLLDEFERVGHVFSVPFRREVPAAATLAPASQKNWWRGASRRRATRGSYRKSSPFAKRNMRFGRETVMRAI